MFDCRRLVSQEWYSNHPTRSQECHCMFYFVICYSSCLINYGLFRNHLVPTCLPSSQNWSPKRHHQRIIVPTSSLKDSKMLLMLMALHVIVKSTLVFSLSFPSLSCLPSCLVISVTVSWCFCLHCTWYSMKRSLHLSRMRYECLFYQETWPCANQVMLYRSLACSSVVVTWFSLWVSFPSTLVSSTMICFHFHWISSSLALTGLLNTIPLTLLKLHPMATCIHLVLIQYVFYQHGNAFTWMLISNQ